MSKVLHLYRGDSILNKNTDPGGFRSEGIRSAAFGGGGDPWNIEKIGPLQTVKTHIDHLTKSEKNYYKITDFISFTEDEAIAKKWAADLKPDDLLDCPVPYQETRYVFHIRIPEAELIPLGKGVWCFTYKCTPHKRYAYREGNFINTMALQQAGCDICGGIQKNHSLILIKPDLLLDETNHPRASKLAVKNDEWLVLPNDRMAQSNSRQTRIYVSDFWEAQLYLKKNEPIRTPDSFQLK